MKRALSYPMKLIAKNAGVNGSVVVEKVGNFIFTILFAFKSILILSTVVHVKHDLGAILVSVYELQHNF